MRLLVDKTISEGSYQGDNLRAQGSVRPHAVKVGISLQNMQVRVHGLGRVIVPDAPQVCEGTAPLSWKTTEVAIAARIERMAFQPLIEIDRPCPWSFVTRAFAIFAQCVDGESLCVHQFAGLQRVAVRGHRPVNAAVPDVSEMLLQIVVSPRCQP